MSKFPLAALTQHVAIVGKTGAGKTYAAKGLVEQLLDTQRRVVVLDPTGAWWGLRSKADGSAGYALPIIGGEHGDVPLRLEHAERLAAWLTDQPRSAVLDLSEMLIGERHRFVEQFADALYRLNRTPLHLVIDEADEFAPQNPLPETRRMLHHVDRIVRRGRIRGFRVMLITQRPAVLHKNVLTQVNTLVALRLTAPQDRKAIEAWVEGQADVKKGREVLDSLARLQRGEGWVWAPELNVLERMRFPAIRTYDSGRSPEDGDTLVEPAPVAVDLGELRALLSPPPEPPRAVAPTTAGLAEYERQRAYAEGHAAGYAEGFAAGRRTGYGEGWRRHDECIRAALADIAYEEPIEMAGNPSPPALAAPTPAEPRRSQGIDTALLGHSNASLSKAERLVLTALAQYPHGRTRVQVAILTGYAHNGGGFNNALSALRTKGFLEGGSDRLTITPSGAAALGPVRPLPRGRDLAEHWLSQLTKAERLALETLIKAYPKALTKEKLAALAGYEPNGGGFNNALSRLRTLELITGRGEVRASEVLFQ